MRTIRRYSTTGQAIGDIAILESQGINSSFKGGSQSETNLMLVDGVELQVDDENVEAATKLLAEADKERYERCVPAEDRKKTPARYFKISLVAFFPLFALMYLRAGELTGATIVMISFSAGVTAILVGLLCARLDI